MDSKPFWKSKTFWVNAVTLGLHYAKPYIGVESIPDVNPMVLATANIILRAISSGRITLN